MFKKKSNLPPRPKYPSTYQILEDLSLVTNEDPLFRTAMIISEKKVKAENAQEHDAMYEKIKKFFAKHEDLQETMKNLKEINKNLKEKESNIAGLSDDLKEEALKALV